MDYIKQILAFDDYLMYNQGLSSGQIALWRALMSINNKTRWSEWFTASNQTLETLAGLSRQGINKNRNVLKQLGLIDFQTNGRKATSYHICKLYTSDSVQESLQEDVRKLSTSNSLQESVQDSLQSSSATVAEKCTTQLRNSSTLYKHKQNVNINKNINDHIEDLGVYEFIQQAWKKAPTGLLQGALGPWIKEWGPELVLYAFKLAYENSVEMQGLKKYVQAILNNWAKRDIKTLEDAEKAREMFEEQKKAGRSGYQKKPVREEKLPNWEGMQEDVPLSDEEQANLERQMQELLGG
ncbi:DnaD domain-containing protein [Enterococcus faecalis]|uniref:DnaD domain-containing protein n=1 Tax=Enterococcus faecalis TaxID=1351 RepID=UPI0011572DAB|nr:DnaD domain protein [Enterococcus faecalis]NSQ31226.1 DnaD domain protein [Enterococcus faecalis]UKU91941.1 DnaD domain protein [Enterococcus faecalis]HCT5214712.1 DnaD domain protein [Enterococcus faecalis]